MNTKQTEALKLALEALETAARNWPSYSVIDALTAIREALADQNIMVVSPECAERGCMAHDDRVDGPGVVVQPAQRCPLCNYQHGHSIGCENNPVDIALAKMAEQPARQQEPDAFCNGMPAYEGSLSKAQQQFFGEFARQE